MRLGQPGRVRQRAAHWHRLRTDPEYARQIEAKELTLEEDAKKPLPKVEEWPEPPKVNLAFYESAGMKDPTPDKTWWVWNGREWVPRFGEEMLGKEF